MTTTPLLPLGPEFPWLAPLAGFSDLPFRLLCREAGAAVACTEMVSAKGLIYGLKSREKSGGTEDLLVTVQGDNPLVVQLFGEDPDFLSAAVSLLRERGHVFFDLNMGCSVPKVCRTGAGAALLRDPANALKVATAMIQAAGEGRAGCKIRLGWDAHSSIYLDLAKGLEDAGAAWICLHPRYARQGFGGKADIAALEKLAGSVRIPVIASGDLFTAEDGIAVLQTGVQGVMFARGALVNPTVFRRFRLLLAGGTAPAAPAPEELLLLIQRHGQLAREYSPCRAEGKKRGRRRAVIEERDPALMKMRTVVPRYVRHLPGAKQLRLALSRCVSWDELDILLDSFFARFRQCRNEEEAGHSFYDGGLVS